MNPMIRGIFRCFLSQLTTFPLLLEELWSSLFQRFFFFKELNKIELEFDEWILRLFRKQFYSPFRWLLLFDREKYVIARIIWNYFHKLFLILNSNEQLLQVTLFEILNFSEPRSRDATWQFQSCHPKQYHFVIPRFPANFFPRVNSPRGLCRNKTRRWFFRQYEFYPHCF